MTNNAHELTPPANNAKEPIDMAASLLRDRLSCAVDHALVPKLKMSTTREYELLSRAETIGNGRYHSKLKRIELVLTKK